MKNYDLLWAREHAGLTQAQAAEKMGVSRDHFCRWETGRVKMPKRRWFAFLKLLEIAEASIPKRVPYDAKGYPLTPDDFGNDDKWDDEDARDKALEVFEGDEYPARERERYHILVSRHFQGYPKAKADLAKAMASYDADQIVQAARLEEWRKTQALLG